LASDLPSTKDAPGVIAAPLMGFGFSSMILPLIILPDF
jgi:hypothetical protein